MFNNKQLLNKIFIKKKQGTEYVIFNHDDKTWIMPKNALKSALDMYQPSSIRGKLSKRFIPILPISVLKKKLDMNVSCFEMNLKVLKKIDEYIDQDDRSYFVAAYMGDTSSWQNDKVTMQIYNDKKNLGYVKVAENEKVYENFRREIEVLNFLNERGIENIPKVIMDEKIDYMYIFMQSTEKNLKEKVYLKFSDNQCLFIKKIVGATSEKLNYKQSDFYKYVIYLKNAVRDFPKSQRRIINIAIELVEEKLAEKSYRYSFFHGDYTPWNIYYKDKELYAFDFEYSEYTMPEYMDIFHYLTQLAMLGKYAQTGGVVHMYRKYKKKILKYVLEPDFIYLCYLLYIVSFYKKRTDENKRDMSREYEIWIGAMENLLHKV